MTEISLDESIKKLLSDVTPIPTEYNGISFRSRLEARWAKFFDLVHITYEYESEGFQEGDKRYLPDFYLPRVYLRGDDTPPGVYLEIKPIGYDTKPDEYKWSVMKDKQFLVCFGNPPPGHDQYSESLQIYPWWDNDMTIMKCKMCGFTKFEFSESNYEICPQHGHDHDSIIDLRCLWYERRLPTDNRIFNEPGRLYNNELVRMWHQS